MIVSILARAEARALPSYFTRKQEHSLVSILARAEARALLGSIAAVHDSGKFQSSPAPRRGRYS